MKFRLIPHHKGLTDGDLLYQTMNPTILLLLLPALASGQCQAPTPLSTTGPNVMLIGDSISMGSSGYSLFVQDILTNASGGALVGSLQHGGGFGGGGQMASSANGAAKVAACVGNHTGTLPPKAWSVVTYNAGLHDCDTHERVEPAAYSANLKAIFETLKPAASVVVFVTTTPYDMPTLPAGLNMSCVVQYNELARAAAAEVGGVVISDLYGYVESFCQSFPKVNWMGGGGSRVMAGWDDGKMVDDERGG